jgi:type IX secretion system PorP/SprF family membrane protein
VILKGKYWILLMTMIVSLQTGLFAQDIHFSQYQNSPLNLNPALTGFMESRYRFGLNHRNQWATVTIPYVTYSAFADLQVIKRKYQGDMLCIGFSANKDQAGHSEFGSTHINGSLSWIKAIGNQNRNIISIGVLGGWSQRSINYQKLNFDEQFDGTIFNPGIGITESFAIDNFSYTDFAAGIHWASIFSYDFSLKTGFSIWHLTNPNQSFMESDDARLPMKSLFYSEAEIRYGLKYLLIPSIYVAYQDPYTEIIPGFKVKYEISTNPHSYTALNFGVLYRVQDAAILVMGLDYKYMSYMASYDFNISDLRKASAYQGGFEVSAIFKFSKQTQKRIKKMECPIF